MRKFDLINCIVYTQFQVVLKVLPTSTGSWPVHCRCTCEIIGGVLAVFALVLGGPGFQNNANALAVTER